MVDPNGDTIASGLSKNRRVMRLCEQQTATREGERERDRERERERERVSEREK